jgi:Ca2+-binding RTX toxin-like protein
VIINPNGILTHPPEAGFTGTDSFTFLVFDRGGRTDTATASVTVVADAPARPEGIVGTAGNDLLFGGTQGNPFRRGAGAGFIPGTLGADALSGGAGHDTLLDGCQSASGGFRGRDGRR